MSTIALVTTCKGRLYHLKETLPLWINAIPDQIVVVDYGCPDETAAWVKENYPDVTVVSVNDDPGFSVARARNFGAQAVLCEWLVFIDADILISCGWLDGVLKSLDSKFFYRAPRDVRKRIPDLSGTFVCQKQYFDQIEGYDELFRGWGHEDDDLYRRLKVLAGLVERSFQADELTPIFHDDSARTRFQKDQSKEMNALLNRFYLEAKSKLIENVRQNISIEVRREIFGALEASFRNGWFSRYKGAWGVKLQGNYLMDGSVAVLSVSNRRRYWIAGPRRIYATCKIT